MLSTILVSDVIAAAVVIGFCGISWAISMWAPFSLLGEYISRQEAISQRTRDPLGTAPFANHSQMMASRVSLSLGMVGTEPTLYRPLETEGEEIEMLRVKELRQASEEGEASGSETITHEEEEEQQQPRENETEFPAAGVLLGIHNMYIVLPQFLVTFLSSFIFRLLEDDTGLNESPPDGIGLILRIGAVMAGAAGFISMKIGKD